MWISKKDEWHARHSSLTKFFIERIIQMVDYDENISNKHRTVNGLIMIDEIIELCKLILLRQKSVNRLKSILTEAIESKITANITNDYVLKEGGFNDIIKFYKDFNLESLQKSGVVNEKVIKDLSIKSRVFAKRLETFYFETLKQHLLSLDENPDEFRRNAKKLNELLNSLLPYLLYQGYSATSINEVAVKLIKKPGNNPIETFFSHFNLEYREFSFLINIGDDASEYNIFLEQLKKRKTEYVFLASDEINSSIFYTKVKYEAQDKFIKIVDKALDPHSYLSELYDYTLKHTVLGNNRTSLQFYTIFFDYSYWKGGDVQKYQPINVNLDPINTLNRRSTLRTSLRKVSKIYNFKFDDTTELPYLPAIEQSVYFYNLALGSKSMENSMSLLWTSLESLIPYHPKNNDIDNIQHFVSTFLSVGSIGRQLNSFIIRLRYSNRANDGCLTKIGTNNFSHVYSEKGLKQWLDWLTKIPDPANDPFEKMNETSVLLCHQYCNLNEKWGGITDRKDRSIKRGKVNQWVDKIENSRISISHQLDRIYLHRNQIVHSGKFINEYSNMWSHLEWYVGKLITYCYIYHYTTDKSNFTKKEVFFNLEGEVEHIKNLLEANKGKEIHEIKNLSSTVFKLIWQYF